MRRKREKREGGFQSRPFGNFLRDFFSRNVRSHKIYFFQLVSSRAFTGRRLFFNAPLLRKRERPDFVHTFRRGNSDPVMRHSCRNVTEQSKRLQGRRETERIMKESEIQYIARESTTTFSSIFEQRRNSSLSLTLSIDLLLTMAERTCTASSGRLA